jgi:glutamate synthase domain-containing protein 2/glutamate synthase domain-containing protein 1/glutamate synthase domain-containing protein 3
MIRQITEKSACGVGFIASLHQESSHQILQIALRALCAMEHRGAHGADMHTADGSGLMTEIPFELLGYKKGTIAVATLFLAKELLEREISFQTFYETFQFWNLEIIKIREVPINTYVLGTDARKTLPAILQVIIKRPDFCRTNESFEKLLYRAKQSTLTQLRRKGIRNFFLPSLSSHTIVYKALTRSEFLAEFYDDLKNPLFKTNFAVFHRRFSTNTSTTWDKAQPFRLVGHNGEINTISGNRSWALAREKMLGLPPEELFTHEAISDSGTVNEIVEALRYRSNIPTIAETLAIMMPPAHLKNNFYKFWGRGMEPWDGPALIVFSDGLNVGARLDRNGFRPCRWIKTDELFCLASEAGVFGIDEELIKQKGMLEAGSSVTVDLETGEISFEDPSLSLENFDAHFDARLILLEEKERTQNINFNYERAIRTFHYTHEDIHKVLAPMITEGKEGIGSMGNTAALAIFSKEPRSFFDFFYHNFAQVTNPPLDYLREKIVTDLSVYLGKKPNIFAEKEFAPIPMAFELKSPILSLGQLEYLQNFSQIKHERSRILALEIDFCFDIQKGVVGFQEAVQRIENELLACTKKKYSIVILTDKYASETYQPIPCVIALRVCKEFLHKIGLSLAVSLVVDSGEIRATHHVATCIALGASAVCPRVALEIARNFQDKNQELSACQKEKNLIKALEQGLLKIMSKMGISVVRSYEDSQLLTVIGLDFNLVRQYFPRTTAYLSGVGISQIVEMIVQQHQKIYQNSEGNQIYNSYLYKEHPRGLSGERHDFTAQIAKNIHQLARKNAISLEDISLYEKFLENSEVSFPIHIRHLWKLVGNQENTHIVQSCEDILKTFGAGAMSFGAISAEAQRDIFLAMRQIGGRSNSGEGGENPYYYSDAVFPTIKQIASGRFGVDALYLISANEYQIKIAQGAKPGEGGQLMGVKVTASIAKARHSNTQVDLISPPPLHDIYSIEDLKELIYQLKQINPYAKVSVKLVSGAGIETIAVGVAKAGADIIHISGGEGGTGAASLSSMKHAGIPWELSLWEVHKALVENQLRENVILRVDGGLQTGKDIIIAAILGAEEFEFGKLLLIAQGCIMARICEKNTCPTGIATHDEKFKAKYKGSPEHIVRILTYLAQNVQKHLRFLGVENLKKLIGRIDLLAVEDKYLDFIQERNIQADFLGQFDTKYQTFSQNNHSSKVTKSMLMKQRNLFYEQVGRLNKTILNDTREALSQNKHITLFYDIKNTDRAVLATLAGKIAWKEHQSIIRQSEDCKVFDGVITLHFRGSAGQGFGVFMTKGLNVRLEGEANDSVAKSMSGGRMVIVPYKNNNLDTKHNVIIGNCALYGAIGGILYVAGKAGDRFAVRNSGATAVVEGVGWHACEYMTRGKVVILGETGYNVGSGMTGGELWIRNPQEKYINQEYIQEAPISDEDWWQLYQLLQDYLQETQSQLVKQIIMNWETEKHIIKKYLPVSMLADVQSLQAMLASTIKS